MRYFITGTGTGVGKTFVACALAEAVRASGKTVCAIKPIETGCAPRPFDADALAKACGRPELADLEGFVRMEHPIAPRAATLEGEPDVDFDALVTAAERAIENEPNVLVEGAGGVAVPLTIGKTICDLATALELPVLLVARDNLGVLSSTLSAAAILAPTLVVLTRFGDLDESVRTNARILREHLPCPVLSLEQVLAELTQKRRGL